MLNRIRQAQSENRILPDTKIDYNNFRTYNPFEIIPLIYPELLNLIKDNSMDYMFEAETEYGTKKREISLSYKKDLEPDYYRIKISTHDGTLLFTKMLYEDLLKDILQGTSYCRTNVPLDYDDNTFGYDLEYTLGNIFLFSDFGMKKINGKLMPGVKEVMVMPVKVEYKRKTA